MKTNFKRIGKQSISIVLAVMMMLSTMLVGMVTSNAVEIKANTDFYLDISKATKYFSDPNSIYMSVVCLLLVQVMRTSNHLKLIRQL